MIYLPVLIELNENDLRFQPKHILILNRASRALLSDDVNNGIQQHLKGDWGDVSDLEREDNEIAIRLKNNRILSSFEGSNKVPFYVFTTADQEQTIVTLPKYY